MYYIYKITNKITNKIYVGRGTIRTKTYGPENDHYYGSGRVIKRSVAKYGKENHTKEILEECETLAEAQIREGYWIKTLDALNPDVGYNLTSDSCGFSSETGGDAARKFYASLSEEQKQLLYNQRAEAMRTKIDLIGAAAKQMWANMPDDKYQEVIGKLKDSWTPEKREAQRKRLTGSKRKSNLNYMIEKYGEEEGRKQYAEFRDRLKKACAESAAKRRILKQTQESK